MNHNEKIKKARIQLILEQPFFATLCMRISFSADDSIQSAVTNGKTISYNPEYVQKMTVEEVKGVMVHEILHITMMHHTRRNNRDKNMWNQACDYAINPLLLASGFSLPAGFLIDDRYRNSSAEQIYSLLQESAIDNNSQGITNSGCESTGDVEDVPYKLSTQEIEAEIKQAVVQAAMLAKRQGNLPEFVQRLVDEMLLPKISWKEVLSRFLAEITRNDYSWKKPSTRYICSGIYLPSLENLETGNVILIVDTSVSIDRNMLNQFAAEVQDIANTFKMDLLLIYVDTQVQFVQEVEPDIPIQLTPKGGGGTDFRPGFVYIDQRDLQPKVVIYLTDGECLSFPMEPDYPVLWAQFGDYDFQPPFGEIVQVQ